MRPQLWPVLAIAHSGLCLTGSSAPLISASSSSSAGAVGEYVASGIGLTVSSSASPNPTTSILSAIASGIITATNTTATSSSSSLQVDKETSSSVPGTSGTRTLASQASTSTSPLATSVQTGSGVAFASSCSAALRTWSSSSQIFWSSHATSTSYTQAVTSSYPVASPLPQTAPDLGLTTLCDGFPRIIGAPIEMTRVLEYTSWTNTITTRTLPSDVSFVTPIPCSISPAECKYLWSSYDIASSAGVATGSAPPCATNTNAASFDPARCLNNAVSATEAQLIYWPATASGQSAYFCAAPSTKASGPDEAPLVTPFFPSPTGQGPNTVVIGTATITSPSVAVQWKGIGRQDGCGPSIDTIGIYDPAQISTVRGYGFNADFKLYPINYADLNWMCPDPKAGNDTFTTAIAPDGNKCYQDVAARAYWQDKEKYGTLLSASNAGNFDKATLTISNDYRVYVSQTPMPSDVFESYFGTDAGWLPFGMWDPPIALSVAADIASATLPGFAAATTTSTQSLPTTLAPPASPVSTISSPQLSPTADTTSSTSTIVMSSLLSSSSEQLTSIVITLSPQKTSVPAALPTSDTESSEVQRTMQRQSNNGQSLPSSSEISTPVISQTNASSSSFTGADEVGESRAMLKSTVGPDTQGLGAGTTLSNFLQVPGNTAQDPTAATASRSVQTGVITLGSSAITIISSTASAIVVGTNTLSIGGSAATFAGQTISAASSGLVIQSGSQTLLVALATVAPSVTGAVASLHNTVVTASKSGSIIAAGGAFLTIGGSATTFDGQIVSAGAAGLVVGSGSAAQTFTYTELVIPSRATPTPTGAVVSFAGTSFTAAKSGSIVAIGSTSLTIGGGAIYLDGHFISADSTGLVLETGSAARTLKWSQVATSSARVPVSSSALSTLSLHDKLPTTTSSPTVSTTRSATVSRGSSSTTMSGGGSGIVSSPLETLISAVLMYIFAAVV